MNPAGKIAFTPQIDKYFPTNGPEKNVIRKSCWFAGSVWSNVVFFYMENSIFMFQHFIIDSLPIIELTKHE